VLKHILSVFTHLFNFIITSSSFSTAWKTAIILLFPKSRVPTGLVDFCPITTLPVLLNGIKRILCDQLVENIESCGFFGLVFGFRRFHSTVTVLTSIMYY
jgi:hypothetical protein